MAQLQPDNAQNAQTHADVTGRPDPARLRRVAQAQRNCLAQGHARPLLQALERLR